VLHRSLLIVPERAVLPLPPSALVDAAVAARPGTPARFVPPASPALSAEVEVAAPSGEVSVFVDPYDGRVLGELPYRGSAMWVVRKLHSLAYLGTAPSYLVEIAGG
jgi:uncharacterized iron-regulated membrane protein